MTAFGTTQPMNQYTYEGDELPTFAQAVRWKRYFRSRLRPWLTGDVLEVGAGQGGTTQLLYDGRQSSWTCLEPDAALAEQISATDSWPETAEPPKVVVGTIADAASEMPSFDTIIYIDVLEHIEHDAEELEQAAKLLKPGGTLIVLSPAWPFLYSNFDRAVGHFRRYTRKSLTSVAPSTVKLERLFFLDCLGALLPLGNRLLLGRRQPKRSQVQFWDRFVIPVSRCLDVCIGYCFGRSIIAVWRSTAEKQEQVAATAASVA
jgi:SAM-dependent methyltransferase